MIFLISLLTVYFLSRVGGWDNVSHRLEVLTPHTHPTSRREGNDPLSQTTDGSLTPQCLLEKVRLVASSFFMYVSEAVSRDAFGFGTRFRMLEVLNFKKRFLRFKK